MSASLVGIGVPDAPDAWRALGFRVEDGAVALVNGALLLGTVGLRVAGVAAMPADLEGIALAPGTPLAATEHPCGAVELDHLVLLTDSLERTSSTVRTALGLERRRIREAGSIRQAFHRFADAGEHRGCIVEVVESDRVHATTLMGVVVTVADLHDLADHLGPDVMSLPKPAVQPGRYISTVRRDVGLGAAVALMTPE